jgi:hypothetical protein
VAWDLKWLRQRHPEAVRPGGHYVLAVMGRTMAGEPFGFSFGVEIGDHSQPDGSVVLPDVLQVICDASSTRVLTPVVRAQPDGLHLRVDDRAGIGNVLIRPSDPVYGDELVFSSGSRGLDAVYQAAPGTAEILCGVEGGFGETHVDDLPWVSFDIVDPDGYFMPYGLACARQDRHQVPRAEQPGSAEALVEAGIDGVLPTDRVEPAGYAAGDWPFGRWFRVVRSDAIVASLFIEEGRNRSELRDGFACDGSGIAEAAKGQG